MWFHPHTVSVGSKAFFFTLHFGKGPLKQWMLLSILAVLLQVFCCLTQLTNGTFWKSCVYLGISAFLF